MDADLSSAAELDVLHGTTVIVIHPGSLHLRLGKASDPSPATIPHCIAWRTRDTLSKVVPWIKRMETQHDEAPSMMAEAAKEAQEQLGAKSSASGKYRKPTSYKDLGKVNQNVVADETDVMSQLQWTDVSRKPKFLIGEDALHLNPNAPYDLIWPFAYSDFNFKNEPGYTPRAILESIETLWTSAIETLLGIPRLEFPSYRCILLIPDIFRRDHVRQSMDLLLEVMGFSAAFVIQESVCATFGTGMASACVVDMGDQKTSIACVEDGISIAPSRLLLRYGGRDITNTFNWLLGRIAFPYTSCRLHSNVMDALLMQELKHSYCHMDTDSTGVESLYFQVRPPNQRIAKYTMQVGDERIQATLAVFWPAMFGLTGDDLVICGPCKQHDPTDHMDAAYIMQTRSRQEESAKQAAARKKEQPLNQPDMADMDDMPKDLDDELIIDEEQSLQHNSQARASSQLNDRQNNKPAGDIVLPLDQAILWSIDQCDNDDTKKRMYSCILVVGGGLLFEGVQELLQYRLWLQMPVSHRVYIDSPTVLTRPKDLDPQAICWKGGSILSLLDTAQELWVTNKDWLKMRSKVLRERAPFSW